MPISESFQPRWTRASSSGQRAVSARQRVAGDWYPRERRRGTQQAVSERVAGVNEGAAANEGGGTPLGEVRVRPEHAVSDRPAVHSLAPDSHIPAFHALTVGAETAKLGGGVRTRRMNPSPPGLHRTGQHPTGQPGIAELEGEAELSRVASVAANQLEVGVGQGVLALASNDD